MTLYQQLANTLRAKVEQGYFQPGDKLPSIRQTSKEHNVSVSTVQEAYRLLEEQRIAEVRPKSGYYVLNKKASPELPDISSPAQEPVAVSQWELVVDLLSSHQKNGILALGKGSPDVNAQSLKPLLKITANISRRADIASLTYDSLEGAIELREQITHMMIDSGCRLHPDDIVITTGCQGALSCSIRSVTNPGDIVAIESPSYYGSMQALQAQNLKALEIPTHPETGISIEALQLALEKWPIKALQVTPICNNPMGYSMPDENKERLIELANTHDIAIIEDDIYGDLSYRYPRPRSIKSYDTEGRVLYCSSFSKTISPAFRTGWCAPGKHLERVKHFKYVATACDSILLPRAIAEFVAQGHYERHVRKMRAQYVNGRDHMIEWVKEFFPVGTKMTYPQGGFVLWVELPKQIDSVVLNQLLVPHKVSIGAGILFSASHKYRNCIRLNFAREPDESIRAGVKVIGDTIKGLLKTE